MRKHFVTEHEHILDGFRLGKQIYQSGFRPTFIVGLWRGGSAVGIAVQEGLEHVGIATDHIAIRTSYSGFAAYSAMMDRGDGIRVHGLQYLLENLSNEHTLLIVDDVYSTGSSVKAVIDQLTEKTRRNLPHDIRIASVYYRPTERTLRTPDFYIHETRDWLVLPYELSGLSLEEISEHKPEVDSIMPRLISYLAHN